MKHFKRSLLCLAVAGALTGCSNDDVVDLPNPDYPVATEGQTIINTPEIVVLSEDKVTVGQELTIALGAVSDIHGRIFGYDYALDAEDTKAGLTRIATLLREEKAKHPNMILMDIGDTVQGNSAQLFNHYPTHPVIESLNAMDFDVWVPGNHEFNFERTFADRNLMHFDGAVLSSNIKWETNGANYLRSWQVFEIDGAKVGVVGLLPSNVPNWEASSPENFAGLEFPEELKSTREAVDELIAKHQPDVMIGAFHLGRSGEGSNGVHKIAAELADKFDIMMNGHEHATYIETVAKDGDAKDISVEGGHTEEDKYLSGEYNESNRHESVKIIESGKWGWGLAKAEVRLVKTVDGWEMVDTTLSNIETEGVEEDQELSSVFYWVHQESTDDAQTSLGKAEGDFTPEGLIDEATGLEYNTNILDRRLYTTIHTAKVVDTPLVDFVSHVQLEKTGATISASSLFSDQSFLEDGQEYTKGTSSILYQYDNTLVGVEMTGKNLKNFMEWSYAYFNQYQDGDLTVSFAEGSRAYNYDQFSGAFEYTVDLTKPALEIDSETDTIAREGERITITEIEGAAFDPAKTYTVAVNNYRFGSQLQRYGWASADDVFYDSATDSVYAVRDMMSEYVELNGGVHAEDVFEQNWHFVQYGTDEQPGELMALRQDGGEGQALWERLQNMEICVQIDWKNQRYPGILDALNVHDNSSWFENPNYSEGASVDELHDGCNQQPAG